MFNTNEFASLIFKRALKIWIVFVTLWIGFMGLIAWAIIKMVHHFCK